MNIVGIAVAAILIGIVIYNFIRAQKRMNQPPSEKVKILTDGTYKQVVSNGVSLVDFWAAWCQPCKVQGPIIDEIAEEIGDKFNICKLDIDQNKRAAAELGIRNIPTIILFKDGQIAERFVGVKAKHFLMKKIEAYQ